MQYLLKLLQDSYCRLDRNFVLSSYLWTSLLILSLASVILFIILVLLLGVIFPLNVWCSLVAIHIYTSKDRVG